MQISCDFCPEVKCRRYAQWLDHILSDGHQFIVRRHFNPSILSLELNSAVELGVDDKQKLSLALFSDFEDKIFVIQLLFDDHADADRPQKRRKLLDFIFGQKLVNLFYYEALKGRGFCFVKVESCSLTCAAECSILKLGEITWRGDEGDKTIMLNVQKLEEMHCCDWMPIKSLMEEILQQESQAHQQVLEEVLQKLDDMEKSSIPKTLSPDREILKIIVDNGVEVVDLVDDICIATTSTASTSPAKRKLIEIDIADDDDEEGKKYKESTNSTISMIRAKFSKSNSNCELVEVIEDKDVKEIAEKECNNNTGNISHQNRKKLSPKRRNGTHQPKQKQMIQQPIPTLISIHTPNSSAAVFSSDTHSFHENIGPKKYRFEPPRPPVPLRESRYIPIFRMFIQTPDILRNDLFLMFSALKLPQQFDEFMFSVPLTKVELEQRHSLLWDFYNTMKIMYPHCQIHCFGSFLTELGDYTSDLDIYFDAYGNQGKQQISEKKILDACVKLLRKAMRPSLNGQSKRLINTFKAVQPIRGAKVPIVKFTHYTGISCDVSFNNMLALRNSELIKLFVNLHPVVKPFVILVKYWAKFHDIAGSALLKNYSLVLLVLVFLGQRNIVPTIDKLKMLAKKKMDDAGYNPHILGEWDTSFCSDIEEISRKFPPSYSTSKFLQNPTKAYVIFDLFEGFCEMYAYMDIRAHVICPLTAEIIPKSQFSLGPQGNANIPEFIRKQLRVSSDICIQDPFRLDFNISSATSSFTVVHFQSACYQTLKRMRSSAGIHNFFNLFVHIPDILKNKQLVTNRLKHLQTVELKKEIETQLVNRGTDNNNETSHAAADESINPLHTIDSDQETPKGFLKFGVGWEALSCFDSKHGNFRGFFLKDLSMDQRNENMEEIGIKINQFWIAFVRDFLDNIWINCFGLDVVTDKYVRHFGSSQNEKWAEPSWRKLKTDVKSEEPENVTYIKLRCEGLIPARKEMEQLVIQIKNLKNQKPNSEEQDIVVIENPLQELKKIVASLNNKINASFNFYVKLECWTKQTPTFSFVFDQIEGLPSHVTNYYRVLPPVADAVDLLFTKYLAYRAKISETPNFFGNKKSSLDASPPSSSQQITMEQQVVSLVEIPIEPNHSKANKVVCHFKNLGSKSSQSLRDPKWSHESTVVLCQNSNPSSPVASEDANADNDRRNKESASVIDEWMEPVKINTKRASIEREVITLD